LSGYFIQVIMSQYLRRVINYHTNHKFASSHGQSIENKGIC
jgi:hypothetical protein